MVAAVSEAMAAVSANKFSLIPSPLKTNSAMAAVIVARRLHGKYIRW